LERQLQEAVLGVVVAERAVRVQAEPAGAGAGAERARVRMCRVLRILRVEERAVLIDEVVSAVEPAGGGRIRRIRNELRQIRASQSSGDRAGIGPAGPDPVTVPAVYDLAPAVVGADHDVAAAVGEIRAEKPVDR